MQRTQRKDQHPTLRQHPKTKGGEHKERTNIQSQDNTQKQKGEHKERTNIQSQDNA